MIVTKSAISILPGTVTTEGTYFPNDLTAVKNQNNADGLTEIRIVFQGVQTNAVGAIDSKGKLLSNASSLFNLPCPQFCQGGGSGQELVTLEEYNGQNGNNA